MIDTKEGNIIYTGLEIFVPYFLHLSRGQGGTMLGLLIWCRTVKAGCTSNAPCFGRGRASVTGSPCSKISANDANVQIFQDLLYLTIRTESLYQDLH